MPKRTDIESILIIGAGPIIIGQACEFDYSGAQACKALREEGYKVILVNSNPATIMTDPEMADVTYIEPITWQMVSKIIERERPDALLPTMGGQTALNCALDLAREGVLTKFDVELIGASRKAIDKAEDREKFKAAMTRIGLASARSGIAHNLEQALEVQAEIGFPAVIRPSFTLGGTGGGIAYNKEEFVEMCKRGLDQSPTRELLIEQSLLGWKEFEMEVVRDRKDNCIIVCAIENVDPMGVHTGDSITVAPAQTLTDKELQIMRDASIAILREIGVDTGGSNVQFAINPDDGRMMVIEMNPRVSRSSALASKATGFPIAKVAAKLAVGYTLDELQERHHRRRDAGLLRADDRLRRHQGAALRLREVHPGRRPADHADEVGRRSHGDRPHLPGIAAEGAARPRDRRRRLQSEDCRPGDDRRRAGDTRAPSGCGTSPTPSASACRWKRSTSTPRSIRWFLSQIKEIVDTELALEKGKLERYSADQIARSSAWASPTAVWRTCGRPPKTRCAHAATRWAIHPVYKRVDTCAAEFATRTAYLYSTYEEECEAQPTGRKKVIVLGGGPNRIGQGIEFDYCCVHAALALREDGFETIMINCNPETVSTDYDTSDRLYFEPLTLEDVLEIVRRREALRRDRPVRRPDAAQARPRPGKERRADHRHQSRHDRRRRGPRALPAAPAFASSCASRPTAPRAPKPRHSRLAGQIGYPLVVRPSYVLGGRAMEIVHEQRDLERYMREAVKVSNDSPVLLDRFLNDAIEVDVDAVVDDHGDGKDVIIGGIMEHIEQAGVHSGDSACSLPPFSLSRELQDELRRQTVVLARGLEVVGLMNVQFAIQFPQHENGGKGVVYVLEVNPRASRTVPYVSKATGRPLAKIAARCMVGQTLSEQGVTGEIVPPYFAVKEAVFPFIKFPGVDTILGPEMKSTGEVMGVGESFAEAFLKSQLAAGVRLPDHGNVFVSVKNADKVRVLDVARTLAGLGFRLVATRGTATALAAAGLEVTPVNKVAEGRPHIVDMIVNDEIALIVNTVEEKRSAIQDSYVIRRAALNAQVPTYTTLAGARAAATGMQSLRELVPYSIQALHRRLHPRPAPRQAIPTHAA